MSRSQRLSLIAALFAGALPFAGHAAADPAHPSGLHVVARIPGPDGGWDYASFDPTRRRVYVAHGAVVLAIDVDSGTLNPAFAQGNRLHAVVPVPGTDLIVTTNSGDNTAKVISATDGRLLASIPTAEDADGAAYDPKSGLVVVICGDAGTLVLIDPKAMKAVGTIHVGDKLEFGQPDGAGLFFVNVEDKNQVAVVDLASRTVLRPARLRKPHRPRLRRRRSARRRLRRRRGGHPRRRFGKGHRELHHRRVPRCRDLRRPAPPGPRALRPDRNPVGHRPRRPGGQHDHRHRANPDRRAHRRGRSPDRQGLPTDRRVRSSGGRRAAPDPQAQHLRGPGPRPLNQARQRGFNSPLSPPAASQAALLAACVDGG